MYTEAELFEQQRSKLIGIIYRIVGSHSEAEDIVQEAALKWLQAQHNNIQSPTAWLIKIATRLALDYLKSARVKRLRYVGPWLPEPYIVPNTWMEQSIEAYATAQSPEQQIELDESVSMALLVLLESLTPAERIAYVLHDLFGLKFEEIASILGKEASACRQLASRARQKIGSENKHDTCNVKQYRQLIGAFVQALREGDLVSLVSLLRSDVVFHSDGGGKVSAALEILQGIDPVIEFLMKIVSPVFAAGDTDGVVIAWVWFNGCPGLLVRQHARAVTAFNFKLQANAIVKIHALRNPDKLSRFDAMSPYR